MEIYDIVKVDGVYVSWVEGGIIWEYFVVFYLGFCFYEIMRCY